MKAIRVEVSPALHAQVKSMASLAGKTLKQFVLDLLAQSVKQ